VKEQSAKKLQAIKLQQSSKLHDLHKTSNASRQDIEKDIISMMTKTFSQNKSV